MFVITCHILGMYGYKGGPKEGRSYPTVAEVRRRFYEMHEGVRDADEEAGELPLVSLSLFRYFSIIITLGIKFMFSMIVI